MGNFGLIALVSFTWLYANESRIHKCNDGHHVLMRGSFRSRYAHEEYCAAASMAFAFYRFVMGAFWIARWLIEGSVKTDFPIFYGNEGPNHLAITAGCTGRGRATRIPI